MVDVIFADVAQPDQTRIVALNAHNFLKNGGHFVISIKVRTFAFLFWSKNIYTCLEHVSIVDIVEHFSRCLRTA